MKIYVPPGCHREVRLLLGALLALVVLASLATSLHACRRARPHPIAVPLGADFTAPVNITGTQDALTPSLTFQGDTSTGFYRPTNDTLNVAIAGTPQVQIDASAFTITPTLDADLSQFDDPVTFSDTVTFSSTVTFSDTVTFSSTATLNTNLVLVPDTQTLTSDPDTISPDAAVVFLDPYNNYNATISDGSTAGQLLILYNDDNTATVTLDESEYNADHNGDQALAPDESIMLMWTGSVWTMIGAKVSN